MENKELYINTLCFAVVFIPFITALVYITALFMDNNQKELCETLGIGVDTLSDLNKRGLRPTKVGRQYIYLESEVNKFLRENTI